MNPLITYDCFGHCVVCHEDLKLKEIIDNKVQERFSPDYDETEYLLNDFSKMRVCICKPCKSTLKDEDKDKIMECVYRGWEHDVKDLKAWDAKKKKDYLDRYSKKKIVCNSEGVPEDILRKKHAEYLGRT